MTSNSVAESAACKGNTDSGFSKLNECLRSVLMSPTSLALFAIANFRTPNQMKGVQDLFQQPLPVLTDKYDKLLIEAMEAADAASRLSPSPPKKAKTAGEALITTQLEEKLSEAIELADNSELSALIEWYVQEPQFEKGKAKMDLVVYNKTTPYINEDEKPRCYDAYAYMEFGVCKQEGECNLVGLWWQKMDQLLSYLNAICVEKYRGAEISQGKLGNMPGVPFPNHPVLLSVLVWSKSRKSSAIGTFVLEWCGTSKKIRVALLSAELCHDMNATSAAFGRVISLTYALTDLREEKQLAKDVWTYLGPDCAKVGTTKVSRESGLLCLSLSFLVIISLIPPACLSHIGPPGIRHAIAPDTTQSLSLRGS
jgi:hypothetical protein